MIHVFKWLELRCSKQENKKSNYETKNNKKKYADLPKNQFSDTSGIDWPFLNGDISIQLCSPLEEVRY